MSKWYGPCAKCGQPGDRAFLPGTKTLACLACYMAWRASRGLS